MLVFSPAFRRPDSLEKHKLMTLSHEQVRHAVDLGMRAAAVTVSRPGLTRRGAMSSEDVGLPRQAAG